MNLTPFFFFFISLVSVLAQYQDIKFRVHMYYNGKHNKLVKCAAEHPVYRCDAGDTIRAIVNTRKVRITSCYKLLKNGSLSIGNSDHSILAHNENHYYKCFVNVDNVTDVVCIASIQVTLTAAHFQTTDQAVTAQLRPLSSNKVYNLTYTDNSFLHIVCDCSDYWNESRTGLCRLHEITNDKSRLLSTHQRNINKDIWLDKSCDNKIFQCTTGSNSTPLEIGVRLRYEYKKTGSDQENFVLIGSTVSAVCLVAAAAGCVCWKLRERLQKCCCNQRAASLAALARGRSRGRNLSVSSSTHIYEEPVYNVVYEDCMQRRNAAVGRECPAHAPPPAELRRAPAMRLARTPHYTDSELLRMDDDGYTIPD